MVYKIFKLIARAAFKFYCRDLKINNPEILKYNGPIMLAVNHPNSFLDAIILCTIFDKPVYSLARGDAFRGKLLSKFLYSIKMLPVYRISEGVQNLEGNYNTFELCKEIFKKNGIVLIFSEGKCINEWHLRPLKKGTARLAISSWQDGIPLRVLPVGMNYSSFRKFGKNIQLFFGEFITGDGIDLQDADGKSIQTINTNLQEQLSSYVFEIDKKDKAQLHKIFYVAHSGLKKTILLMPSAVGWLLHAPLYYPLKKLVIKKSTDTDHFDSLVVAILFFAYPIYVFLITAVAVAVSGHWYAILLFFIFPVTGWAHLQLKKQMD